MSFKEQKFIKRKKKEKNISFFPSFILKIYYFNDTKLQNRESFALILSMPRLVNASKIQNSDFSYSIKHLMDTKNDSSYNFSYKNKRLLSDANIRLDNQLIKLLLYYL